MTETATPPACAVIIPTYNRAPVLQRCLDALEAQTLPGAGIEIIVADDGSTDATASLVAARASRPNLAYRYFRQANAGANAARNAALRIAAAPIALIINDDTIATPGLIATHLALHAAHPEPQAAALGGMTIAPELPPSVFAALHHDASYAAFDGLAELGWDAFFTCNLSVKRDFLLEHGLFDEDLRWHEDIELGERLAAFGLRLFYCQEALGLHLHALNEADYFRIAAREGRALAQWHLKRQASGRPDNALVADAIRPAFRHRAANAVLNARTLPLATKLAAGVAAVAPGAARPLYAKIFQRLKRQAMNDTLAQGKGEASASFSEEKETKRL